MQVLGTLQVAGVSTPSLQLDLPETSNPVLHVGAHDPPCGIALSQSLTFPFSGAYDASQVAVGTVLGIELPKVQ